MATAQTPQIKKPNSTTIRNHNGMILSFLEPAAFWSGIIAVSCAFLAAGAGVAAWYFSHHRDILKDAASEQFQRESSEKIAVANSEAAKANERAAEANKKAEEERLARVKLEEAVAPRSLGEQSSFAEKLKPFAGTRVIVESLADAETGRLTDQMALVFNLARWNILSVQRTLDETGFKDGITVEWSQGNVGHAADAFAKELEERELNPWPSQSKEVPPEVVRVRVGLKPTRFFLMKSLPKDIWERVEDMEVRLKEYRERMKEEDRLLEEATKKEEEKRVKQRQ